MKSNAPNRRKRIVLVCLCIVVLIAAAVLGFALASKKEYIVGKHIAAADITEFYYTLATSTYPPDYQRYHFYAENGEHFLYHETREGDHWPLTEADITLSGTVPLRDEQWAELILHLQGGMVVKRGTGTQSGGSAPALYLYWNGDKETDQEFSFASLSALTEFEAFCLECTAPNEN